MICEICGEETATVHYKEMKDGKVSEYHLCEKCAAEKGIQVSSKKQPFSIANILAGMAEEVGTEVEACPTCGLTYKEFREIGRLGCPDCYSAFKQALKPLLRRIHGSNVHIGKSPRSSKGVFEKRREIENLKDELKLAVDCEEFEKAADIRDRIKDLESE